MSFFKTIKIWVKKTVPDPIWQRIRGATRCNLFFGLIFTLFFKKYRSNGLIFEISKKQFPIPNRASLLFDIYEGAERQKVENYIQPEDSIVELGGGIGVIACTANRILSDKTRHVVVEPNPETLPFLYRNRRLNRAEFLVINSVISPKKIVTLTVSNMLTESRVGESGQTCRIAGVTLGELDEKFGPFNVLVMDIEGAEKFVVETNADTVSKFRLIILELHPSIIGEDECDKIRDKFVEIGFERLEEKSCVEAWRKNARL